MCVCVCVCVCVCLLNLAYMWHKTGSMRQPLRLKLTSNFQSILINNTVREAYIYIYIYVCVCVCVCVCVST